MFLNFSTVNIHHSLECDSQGHQQLPFSLTVVPFFSIPSCWASSFLSAFIWHSGPCEGLVSIPLTGVHKVLRNLAPAYFSNLNSLPLNALPLTGSAQLAPLFFFCSFSQTCSFPHQSLDIPSLCFSSKIISFHSIPLKVITYTFNPVTIRSLFIPFYDLTVINTLYCFTCLKLISLHEVSETSSI